ncbi:MAG TPA: c(7)-type cytochrome triheme domain-containing protein [Rhodocyclaceae bacterium]|nr:c(7)-type cytochrome triheme domain-containing protein [Rhodocyclaceae bacterium]
MKILNTMVLLAAGVAMATPVLAEQSGKEVFSKVCTVCHSAGLAGAPRYGNGADWAPRAANGIPNLYQSALKGTPKGMPAKGGNLALSDAEVKGAVDYMLAAVKDAIKPAKAEVKKEEPKKEEPKRAESKPAPAAAPAAAPAVIAAPTPAAAPAAMPVADAAASAAAATPATTDSLSFNRLLKPASKRNLPPPEDGIHDPSNDGTHALQPPLTVFGALPKSFAGNRVNWVEALNTNKINPRSDRLDPKAEQLVMDLNIVREVKGYMPDVVYPHKQHTQWLDCSNCHPAIFVPQKGANSISMAAILMGEKCGVCHGKVAFPVSECRICHSKKKDAPRMSQPVAAAPAK